MQNKNIMYFYSKKLTTETAIEIRLIVDSGFVFIKENETVGEPIRLRNQIRRFPVERYNAATDTSVSTVINNSYFQRYNWLKTLLN